MTAPATQGSQRPPLQKDQKALDKAVIGGLAWTAGVKWTGQVVAWGTTLIVARLLTPADYGLVGMATIFLGLITLFSEFGIGIAVITFHELTDSQLSQLHTVCVVLGILGFLVSCGLARPIGLFFRAPKLPLVIVVTATGFLIVAYRTIPYSLLRREMRFKLLALLEGFQVIAQAISTLVLAIFGFKYWALVIGGLIGQTASAVLPFVYEPLWFSRPQWKSIGKELKYSWHVIVGRLYFYGYDNADMLIVGRILGEGPLGAYSLAWTLAHVPVEKFTTLINRVTPSLFAAVRTDLPELRRYLRNLTQAIALVVFPAGIGTALVAPEFVHLILGKKWEDVIVPLQLLALYAGFRAIRTLLGPLLNVLDEPRTVKRNSLLLFLVLPLCFYIGSRWGVAGVAAGWVLFYPLLSLPLFKAALEKSKMRTGEYFASVWPALSSTISLVLVVLLLKWSLPGSLPLSLRFSSEILAGGAAYGLTLLLLHRERILAFYQLRKLLAKTA